MPSDNDVIDEAFADSPVASAESSGDPIDEAFENHPSETRKKTMPAWMEIPTGAGEALLNLVGGTVATIPAGLAGVAGSVLPGPQGQGAAWEQKVMGAVPQPQTQTGKNIMGIAGMAEQGADWFGTHATEAFGRPGVPINSPLLQTVAKTAALVAPALLLRKPGSASAAAETGLGGRSVGAAEATIDNRIAAASPEIRQAHADLDTSALSEPEKVALDNHLKADSIGIKLTEGQALRDPDIISTEQNRRGATGLAKFLTAQGDQLKQKLFDMRDEVGPDVFSTNEYQHGQSLIQSYKDLDAPVVEDIRAKYKALEDANGGNLPIDGEAFAASAKAALRKKLKTNYLPSGISADVERFANGEPMNFEDFEALRTNLAGEIRKAQRSGDGNASAASGIVREALENFPLKGDAAKLKPLADAARGAAKARFDALNADPAYDAAVNDAVAPDDFVGKFITGKAAKADNVMRMRANLIKDKPALQTMSVAALDDLREAAGIKRDGGGKFGQSRYNSRLEALDPKLQSLLPPNIAETAKTLGDVGRLIKEYPEGETVNKSNTLSGAIKDAADSKLGKAAETVINAKTSGLTSPLINWGKAKLGESALRAEYERATRPLAGVGKRK